MFSAYVQQYGSSYKRERNVLRDTFSTDSPFYMSLLKTTIVIIRRKTSPSEHIYRENKVEQLVY